MFDQCKSLSHSLGKIRTNHELKGACLRCVQVGGIHSETGSVTKRQTWLKSNSSIEKFSSLLCVLFRLHSETYGERKSGKAAIHQRGKKKKKKSPRDFLSARYSQTYGIHASRLHVEVNHGWCQASQPGHF